MAVIDGNGLILGRMASNIAERLIKGEQINVVNSEKIIISGRKEVVVGRFKRRIGLRCKGNPFKGPQFPKLPHMLVKKSISGMLPSIKKMRGRTALKRLKCFIGVPETFSKARLESVAEAKKKLGTSFISIEELCRALGAKW